MVMMRFLFFLLFFSNNWSLKLVLVMMKKVMHAYERDLGFGDIFNQCVMRRKSAQKKTNVKVLLEANTSLKRDKISHDPFLFVFSRVK